MTISSYESGEKASQLPYHPLVTKLLGESDPPPDVVPLVGYLGPSRKLENVRLYLSNDLLEYYEVPREAVLVAPEPADPADPDGPTRIFVRYDTRLERIEIRRTVGEAGYLEGQIVQKAFAPTLTEANTHVEVDDRATLLTSNPPRKCKRLLGADC